MLTPMLSDLLLPELEDIVIDYYHEPPTTEDIDNKKKLTEMIENISDNITYYINKYIEHPKKHRLGVNISSSEFSTLYDSNQDITKSRKMYQRFCKNSRNQHTNNFVVI